MMPSIDLSPPVPETAVSQANAWLDPAPPQTSAEPFDAVMGRALTRSPNKESDDPEDSQEPPARKERIDQKRKPDSITPRVDPCSAAENSAAPAAPAAVPSPEASTAQPAANPRIEAASVAGPATGSMSTESTHSVVTPAAGSGSKANDASELVPSAGTQPQAAREGLPSHALPENDGSGLKTGLQDEPAAPDPTASLAGDGMALTATPITGKAAQAGSAGGPDGIAMNPVPETMSPAGSDITGISSAQHQAPMQKAEKTNDFSALAEQKLPVSPAGNTGEDLPVGAAHAPNPLPHSDKSELSTVSGTAVSSPASPAQAVSLGSEVSQWPSVGPARSLERAHDLMSLHAFRLRDSGADSLQVVIKPGAGLQLSLNLQMRNGNVEMHATLQRGDFDLMSRHWRELQQQLEPRGIRLGALTCGEQSAGSGNPLFQDSGRHQTAEDTLRTGALDDFSLAGALKPAAANQTNTPRGWEKWA